MYRCTQKSTAPSSSERLSSSTAARLTASVAPSPSHAGHAPSFVLNENCVRVSFGIRRPHALQRMNTKKSLPRFSVSSSHSSELTAAPQCGHVRTCSFSNTMRRSVYASVTVPTVERGLRLASVCDTRMAGDAPAMRSTCGLRMPSSPSASRYWRWHSLNSTSTSSVDLPDPDSPVNATSLPFGTSSETPLRLPSRAFWMEM